MRAIDFPFFDTAFAAFAHRGGAKHPDLVGKENSLQAFQHAVDLGYRYLETDVQATRDEQLVAFHDEMLDRVTDSSGSVVDLTYAELQRVRIAGTEPIPRLDDLLDAFPEARFNLDLKHPNAITALVRTIERHRAQDRVCVASFSTERIRAFRRLMGRRVPTAVSPAGAVWNGDLPLLPRLLNSPGIAFQLPLRHSVLGKDLRVVTRRLVKHAHAAGKVVHAWTIDDEQMVDDLIDLGLDGVFTDRTDIAKRVLQQRGLWEGPQ